MSLLIKKTYPRLVLRAQCWDDECVVFDADTGSTHLIDEFAFEIIKLLEIKPLLQSELESLLAPLFELGEGVQLDVELISRLNILEKAGLVKIEHESRTIN